MGVLKVDNGGPVGRKQVEKAELGRQVVIHVGMVIQVVLGKIGEDRHIEVNIIHPALFQGMG